MAKKQLIGPVTNAAQTTITASTFSNYVEIQEDGSGSAAGLKVWFASDNFTQMYEYGPSAQPIKIGTPPNTGAPGIAPIAGKPVNTRQVPSGVAAGYVAVSEPATIYCKVQSMGADTYVRVDERP